MPDRPRGSNYPGRRKPGEVNADSTKISESALVEKTLPGTNHVPNELAHQHQRSDDHLRQTSNQGSNPTSNIVRLLRKARQRLQKQNGWHRCQPLLHAVRSCLVLPFVTPRRSALHRCIVVLLVVNLFAVLVLFAVRLGPLLTRQRSAVGRAFVMHLL